MISLKYVHIASVLTSGWTMSVYKCGSLVSCLQAVYPDSNATAIHFHR